MNWFLYKRCIKVIIHKKYANVEIKYLLHSVKLNVSILSEIKHFILENIDLLLREIYKRLVEYELSTNIHQKQIYFW